MSGALTQHKAIEIKIANVGLVPKLDAIGAALTAVREAHRDGMPVKCWAAINRANEAIAEAILSAGTAGGGLVLTKGVNDAAGTESGLHTNNSPAPLGHGAGLPWSERS